MWNLCPCPNPESGFMDDKMYDEYIEKLKHEDYDGVILFCHTEFEHYNIPRYKEIIDITRERNLKVYAIMGVDHDYENTPEHVEIISWPSNFCRETLEQLLHWYNNGRRNIDSIDKILIKNLDDLEYKYHFVYLNGKSHIWRSLLLDTVAKHDLLKYSAYSWHAEYTGNPPYPFKYYNGAKKVLDNQFAESKDQGWMPKEYYESFFQLVPESTLKTLFITEKSMVPLIVGKPFLVAGRKGINRKIESLGFKLYDELFDYSFDDIENTEQRYDAICEQVKKICEIPLEKCKEFNSILQDKITYNRNKAIELAYDPNQMPELARQVIKHYDDTGEKIDWWLIETERRLRDIKNKYF
jgi:hypothetical protein